jgi:hypothetical protein
MDIKQSIKESGKMKTKSISVLLFCSLVFLTVIACGASKPSLEENTPTEQTDSKAVSLSKTPTMQPGNITSGQAFEPNEEFIWSTANGVSPNDVLEEISYYGQGGGQYCTGDEKKPVMTYEPLNEELMTLSTLIACGWERNEILTGTIKYPNGKSVTSKIQTKSDEDSNYGIFGFRPAIDDPPGIYVFTLEGKKGRVEAKARFSKPNGPRLFQFDNGNLLLYGFAPKENVRLFVYFDNKLAAWQEYQVNQSGQLIIKYLVPNKNYELVLLMAIGDQSGEVHLKYENHFGRSFDILVDKSIQKVFCGGVYSRLTLANSGHVAFTDGADMRIRKKPGFSHDVMYKVPEGTGFNLLDGPECVDNVFWWQIQTEEKLEGWMAEFQDGIFLLDPGYFAN